MNERDNLLSKYEVFCRAIELRSFTKAAKQLRYSQSAVSQTIKSIETELGLSLVERKKDGISLTEDGRQIFPYIQAIQRAEHALQHKKMELHGLWDSTVRIGTFTSVSRNLLPRMMKNFKEYYPAVNFVLQQGEYTSIENWVKDGSVDFGFINIAAASADIDGKILFRDEMMAVLPKAHPLAAQTTVSLAQLAMEPFILLDEGEYSVPMLAFQQAGQKPEIEYKVYDDYSILAMVRQQLGISMMYRPVLQGFEADLAIRPITEKPERTIALVWKKWETMPIAARKFAEFIIDHCEQISEQK